MNLGLAIVIGGALIAAGIAISHRYEITAISPVPCGTSYSCAGAWRTDNWTGAMDYCEYDGVNVSKRAICQRIWAWSEH